jgi:hypothetical protein
MELGQLVQVPSVFTRVIGEASCFRVLTEISEEAETSHFLVPTGTPGIFMGTSVIEGYTWSKVLFPQGAGWIDAGWLRSVK